MKHRTFKYIQTMIVNDWFEDRNDELGELNLPAPDPALEEQLNAYGKLGLELISFVKDKDAHWFTFKLETTDLPRDWVDKIIKTARNF